MSWARKPKYKNKKVERAGYSFASKLEASLFDFLKLREAAGEIRDIQLQDTVYLTAARIIYKPDYKFFEIEENDFAWAESKGFETSDWRIKRRLWLSYGPGKLYIYKGTAARLVLDEILIPKGEAA